jgi:hypothetical protein
MRRRAFLGALAALATSPAARGADRIEALRFSSLAAGAPLPPWLELYAFKNRPRHTEYALVEDDGRTVLRARADAATSGLIRRLRVDPAAHPILAWRWKVARLVEKGDLRTKEGDDYAARLYVTFDLDPATLPAAERAKLELAELLSGMRLPAAALCYVWDRRAAAGTIAPNPYTERVRMLVAESGSARLGRWVAYQRDIAADFRSAFGAALPVPPVSGVIVSTDTDNTGERVEAFYGDVEFRARRSS